MFALSGESATRVRPPESESIRFTLSGEITESGRACVQRYRDIRETCLIDALQADNALNKDIGDLARLLRVLSGMYDQAARAAASL